MQKILDFVNTENYLLILTGIIIILFVLLIILLVNNIKTKKQYKRFIKKLGNGKNIEEDLTKFMNKVEMVQEQNKEIISYCNNIEKDISKCIQKVGIVRYSAFRDTGSDLSFALALLNDNNDGVLLNGIYSREMSNIYAKPIQNGKSTYTVSEEEAQAIQKAIDSDGIHKIK